MSYTMMKRKEKHGKAEKDRRVAETLNMWLNMYLCEFEAGLVYRAIYRTARTTWTLCQKKKKQNKAKWEEEEENCKTSYSQYNHTTGKKKLPRDTV